ncbi:ATP-binding protein [Amycolatopsis palatopharyngis]|uniref:ATP-binding protein n=1 Tax=Amycolatopsis palatopharyngis TaxID=187982 RepID=UPI001FE5837E|nr:tetratricopeptide repeat protein [Amycolatopsis palatopharyngis]
MAELLDAQQQSGAMPVVCIDGPPGVGKTAVALRYAHDIGAQYPGGVLYANLNGYGAGAEPAGPSEVLNMFLRSMGTNPDHIPAGCEERATTFRSLVHGRRILVVLDNAASSRQVRPLLPGSADCAVLVTSRQRLTGLLLSAAPATSVTLNPLGPDDARDLLRKVIGAERIDAERQAADNLARRCAYLPLALRIASVKIAAHPHDSLADLADGLSAENERLDFLSAGDEDTLTVRGVFSWSYQALPPQVARQFRLLGLHPGATFGVGAAAALADVPGPVAQRMLDMLTEAHLIEETGRDRYQLHDLLRVYAAEQARAESHDECSNAIRREIDWYLASSDAAVRALTPHRPHFDLPAPMSGVRVAGFGPDEYDRALRWCDLELPTMVGLTRLAEEEQLFEQAWQLPVTWLDYFFLRRPWDEWIRTHAIGVVAAKQAGSAFGHGWALTNLAEAYRRRGDLETAERQFQQALKVCPGRTGRGWVLAGLAFTRFDRGEYRSAVRYLEQMVEVFESIDGAFGVATALANLGDAYRELGELDRAWSCGKRAYELYVSIDDRPGQGYALSRMARTAHQRGEHDQALSCCEQALLVNREVGDRWEEADVLEVQGTILREIGNERAGIHSLSEALSLFEVADERRALRLRQQLDGECRTDSVAYIDLC